MQSEFMHMSILYVHALGTDVCAECMYESRNQLLSTICGSGLVCVYVCVCVMCVCVCVMCVYNSSQESELYTRYNSPFHLYTRQWKY